MSGHHFQDYVHNSTKVTETTLKGLNLGPLIDSLGFANKMSKTTNSGILVNDIVLPRFGASVCICSRNVALERIIGFLSH